MALAVDREVDPGRPFAVLGVLGWPAVVAGASLAAGAVHAAAIGVHAEHRQAVVAFTALAVLQLAAGVAALVRPTNLLLLGGALVNAGAFAGFVAAKTSGVGFVEGLDVPEPVQTADGLAAGLALVAVLAAGSHVVGLARRSLAAVPVLTGATAVLVAGLAVPGMLAAGSHTHAHGSAAGAHDHGVPAEVEGEPGAEPAVVPPKPYDPALPIDLGGVEGVTPEQQAAAENLLSATILSLPQFSDPAEIEAMGFVSIGDGFLGHEHYINSEYVTDGRVLDPNRPESLVFDTTVEPKRLAAAMYMLNPGDTLDDVPELGGRLTQWHVHDNLCFAGSRVAGLTNAEGDCGPGLTKFPSIPMIHVWIEPNPCGPFAALDGIAGGRVPDGETKLCDHVHG